MNVAVKKAVGLVGANVSLSLQEMRVIKEELKTLEDNTTIESSNRVTVPSDSLNNILYVVKQLVANATTEKEIKSELFGIKSLAMPSSRRKREDILASYTIDIRKNLESSLTHDTVNFLEEHNISVENMYLLAKLGNYREILYTVKQVKLTVFLKKSLIYNYKLVTPKLTVMKDLGITHAILFKTLLNAGLFTGTDEKGYLSQAQVECLFAAHSK